MRFGQGCHARKPRWTVPFLLLGCCVCLPGAAISLAQETEKPLDQLDKPKSDDVGEPKSIDLENVWRLENESDGKPGERRLPTSPKRDAVVATSIETTVDMSFLKQLDLRVERFSIDKVLNLVCEMEEVTTSEAQQMLLESLPIEAAPPHSRNLRYKAEDVALGGKVILGGGEPNAKIVRDHLFVLGDTATLNEVKQHLSHVEKHGFAMILVDFRVLEVPTQELDQLASSWDQVAVTQQSELNEKGFVVQAGYNESSEKPVDRMFRLPANTQINEIFDDAKTLTRPSILLANGMSGSIMVGGERPFVTDVELSPSGDESEAQSKIEFVHQGIEAKLHATLESKEKVNLQFDYRQTEIEGVDAVKVEKEGTEISIQQPIVNVDEISFATSIPTETYFAVTGTEHTREQRFETGIPILSSIPFINRSFKNVGIKRESFTTVVLVRFQRVNRTELDSTAVLESETTTDEAYEYVPNPKTSN